MSNQSIHPSRQSMTRPRTKAKLNNPDDLLNLDPLKTYYVKYPPLAPSNNILKKDVILLPSLSSLSQRKDWEGSASCVNSTTNYNVPRVGTSKVPWYLNDSSPSLMRTVRVYRRYTTGEDDQDEPERERISVPKGHGETEAETKPGGQLLPLGIALAGADGDSVVNVLVEERGRSTCRASVRFLRVGTAGIVLGKVRQDRRNEEGGYRGKFRFRFLWRRYQQ